MFDISFLSEIKESLTFSVCGRLETFLSFDGFQNLEWVVKIPIVNYRQYSVCGFLIRAVHLFLRERKSDQSSEDFDSLAKLFVSNIDNISRSL